MEEEAMTKDATHRDRVNEIFELPKLAKLRSSEEKILLEGRCSKDIASTLRYMKQNGWEHIGRVRMLGKHRAVLTMKEEYYDNEVQEILEKMSRIFCCSVLASWGDEE
tara:strand:- start:483 stop:806 length:324 start_codon:yes stop_codon:yes gene_type:complete